MFKTLRQIRDEIALLRAEFEALRTVLIDSKPEPEPVPTAPPEPVDPETAKKQAEDERKFVDGIMSIINYDYDTARKRAAEK